MDTRSAGQNSIYTVIQYPIIVEPANVKISHMDTRSAEQNKQYLHSNTEEPANVKISRGVEIPCRH